MHHRFAALTPAPYKDRVIRFANLLGVEGWKIKVYHVSVGSQLPAALAAAGTECVEAELARLNADHHGYGFGVIQEAPHMEYVVLGSWKNRNELELHAWHRTPGERAWKKETKTSCLTLCGWAQNVIGFETQAWWARVVTARETDPEAYVGDFRLLITL